MSIPIRLGTVSKRINSTYQPDATLWDKYDVALKQDTSLEAPVFLLQGSATTFAGCNYCVADAPLTGYYWITDIVSVANNRCEIHCSRDFLAMNKTAIQNTNCFVEYGFNTFDAGDSSHRLPDVRPAIEKVPSISRDDVDITGGRIGLSGQYVLQVVGSDNGVRTYIVGSGTMHTLIDQLNNDLGTSIDNIVNDTTMTIDEKLLAVSAFSLKKSLLVESAVESIKSCIWVPITYQPLNHENIWLGNYDTGIDAYYIENNFVLTEHTTLTIPWPKTDWRRGLCQLMLYLPFIGTVPIPVDQVNQATSLDITWSFEFFSGDMAVSVRADGLTGPVLYNGGSNISAKYAIGTSNVGTARQVGGALQMIGGGLQAAAGIIDIGSAFIGAKFSLDAAGTLGWSGNTSKLSSGVNGLTSGVSGMWSGYTEAVTPLITSTGLMSGLAGLGQTLSAVLYVFYYDVIDLPNFAALYGHPVFSIQKPAAGFCKTRGFSLAAADFPGDIAYINAAMDGGVFIE